LPVNIDEIDYDWDRYTHRVDAGCYLTGGTFVRGKAKCFQEKKMAKDKNAKKADKYKIRVIQNGSYFVSGGVPLSEQIICIDSDGQPHGWKEGKKYPTQENYALCRCGHSQKKPYCDGTHNKIQFDASEDADTRPYLGKAVTIDGPGLKLTDAEDLCAGAGFCHRGGEVWQLVKESEKPDARQTAIEESGDCPSGRLVAWGNEGKPLEPIFEPSIALVEDPQSGKSGPIWVRGGIFIECSDGLTLEVRNRVTLCRCGKSENKPFCDGSHGR
jgi:CDGSH-type Zn-finger protein